MGVHIPPTVKLPHPKTVQKTNEQWWAIRGPEYPFHTETTIFEASIPLTEKKYGNYVYCPFPTSKVMKWGFTTKKGLEAFKADMKAKLK